MYHKQLALNRELLPFAGFQLSQPQKVLDVIGKVVASQRLVVQVCRTVYPPETMRRTTMALKCFRHRPLGGWVEERQFVAFSNRSHRTQFHRAQIEKNVGAAIVIDIEKEFRV
jgi:hypothetical protein